MSLFHARFAALVAFALAAAVSVAPVSARQPKPAANDAALKAAAEKGDARAQLTYAAALGFDRGRPWAQMAADQGLAEAWFWLGADSPPPVAQPFYEKAAELGYAAAFSPVLEGLLFRAEERADIVKAKRFADMARAQRVDVGLGPYGGEELATVDACFAAGRPELPAEDGPTPQEVAAFVASECDDLLEGIGQPRDLRKYSRCVLSKDPLDRHAVAEIYANGWGVKRNARLATAWLCHSSDVPAELVSMVHSLAEGAGSGGEWRYCDYVLSRMNTGGCAGRADDISERKFAAELSAMTSTWSAVEKAAFAVLEAAAKEFFETHVQYEVDWTGTIGPWLAQSEGDELRNEFIVDLRAFEQGSLPANADFGKTDAELNALYKRVLRRVGEYERECEDSPVWCPTRDGIREAEVQWLTYRDAWADFGTVRYPDVPASSWKAWATMKRIAQLRAIPEPQQ